MDDGVIVLIVIGAIVLICLYIWIIAKMIETAIDKGHEEKVKSLRWMFFGASVFGLGLLPFLYVLGLPDLVSRKHTETIISNLERIGTCKKNSKFIQEETLDGLPEL